MNITASYIIVRYAEQNRLEIIKQSEKLKNARYFLQYMAKSGDAIFITNKHNLYKGSGDPTYMCHVSYPGKIEFNEKQWLSSHHVDTSANLKFCAVNDKKETEIFNLDDVTTAQTSLEEIKRLVDKNTKQLEILLANHAHILLGNTVYAHASDDLYLISVDEASEAPFTLTLKRDRGNPDLEHDLQCLVRPRTSG